MKIRDFLITSAALLFMSGANAAVIECVDTAGNSGSGGATASSSIDTGASSATVSNTDCGPWAGNDPKDFETMYGTVASGWMQLDKADGADSTRITGTGWGTTSGTFSLNDTNWTDYLIVLKFDGVFSAFLSDTGVINAWGWNTDTDGDGQFAISHLSVYVRGESVPAPGPLVVMAIGLVGILGLRRARKVI